MKKRIQFHLLIVSLLILILSGCSKKSNNYEERYLDYNEIIEKYALALIEKDYYTMRQYLSKSALRGDTTLENATKKDKPYALEVKEKMGEHYGIYAFDYFYEEYGEMYYLIEYYNFEYVKEQKEKLVFGVKQEKGKLIVFNKYGRHIEATHFKEITNDNNYVTPNRMEKMMEAYPKNSFVVKEYPD